MTTKQLRGKLPKECHCTMAPSADLLLDTKQPHPTERDPCRSGRKKTSPPTVPHGHIRRTPLQVRRTPLKTNVHKTGRGCVNSRFQNRYYEQNRRPNRSRYVTRSRDIVKALTLRFYEVNFRDLTGKNGPKPVFENQFILPPHV